MKATDMSEPIFLITRNFCTCLLCHLFFRCRNSPPKGEFIKVHQAPPYQGPLSPIHESDLESPSNTIVESTRNGHSRPEKNVSSSCAKITTTNCDDEIEQLEVQDLELETCRSSSNLIKANSKCIFTQFCHSSMLCLHVVSLLF